MINHLEISTITALVCALAAMFLGWAIPGKSSAALRHLILLIGVLRFAAYTPWLVSSGARLAQFVPAHTSPAPRLVHVTVHLILRSPQAVLPLPGTSGPGWQPAKEAAWLLWYAGAGLGLMVWLRRLSRPMRSIREATFWERGFFLPVAAAAGASRAELWIVTAGSVPGAQGWLRPRVLLPDGLMNELSEAELEPVLAHELAHLRRRDPLAAGAVRAIASVFWFHPLLWWMERRMLAERETACDEMVLAGGASPDDYVAGIAKVCRNLFGGAQAYAGITGAGSTGANLARRMEHILASKPRLAWPRFTSAIPVLMAVAAALIPVAGGLLRAQTAKGQADALFQSAQALRQIGDLTGALELFRAAEASGNGPAGLAVALILDSTGRSDQALAQYERVLKNDPNNAVALNNAAYILAADDRNLDVAVTFAERAHELKLDSLDILDTLGWVYIKRNMPDQAIRALRDPVLKDPNHWPFRSHMAQALDEKMDPPEWMRELRSVIFGSTEESEARLKELLQGIGR